MDFRWLQDFLSLAETGNFTEAAKARHSSQSAFSRRVQSLEHWLGFELIDRSCYPTRLTAAGERFRKTAAEMVRQMSELRAEVNDQPSEGAVLTFALPHALATGRFPQWWNAWRGASGAALARLIATNAHDAVTAHVAGLADVLICFHHAQQPIFLDPEKHQCVVIGTEWLRPYTAAKRGRAALALPGTAKAPVPVLGYSPNAFLGRMTDIILQSAPVKHHVVRVFETDLADATLQMVVAGHGVGWLLDCTAAQAMTLGKIRTAGGEEWCLPLTINAYCDRSRATPAARRLMRHLEVSGAVPKAASAMAAD
jgi:DNA-binding transcriptional LysR family regulator